MIKIYQYDYESFEQELKKYTNETNELMSQIIQTIENIGLNVYSIYENYIDFYQENDFLYNESFHATLLNDLNAKCNCQNISNDLLSYDINKHFYEGFGF